MLRTNNVSPTSPREWSVIRIYTCNYKKTYYWSAVHSNRTILRRYLCQVNLEGKLRYLRNTGDFHGHYTLNNWSLWDQGGPALVVENIDIRKLCQSWWYLCMMSVFSTFSSILCIVHAFMLFFISKLGCFFFKESYKTLREWL